jgi:hypothetical protein
MKVPGHHPCSGILATCRVRGNATLCSIALKRPVQHLLEGSDLCFSEAKLVLRHYKSWNGKPLLVLSFFEPNLRSRSDRSADAIAIIGGLSPSFHETRKKEKGRCPSLINDQSLIPGNEVETLFQLLKRPKFGVARQAANRCWSRFTTYRYSAFSRRLFQIPSYMRLFC